ncbi:MAG TPA: hypothetical protein VIS05_08465 [Ilumatobacter sp.]
MAKSSTPKRGRTAPKGRPTRSRSARAGRQRTFGPRWQWMVVTLVLVVLFVLLVAATDGGDFNPFNDTNAWSNPVPVFAAAAPG